MNKVILTTLALITTGYSAMAGDLYTDNLTVSNNARVYNNLYIGTNQNCLQVGNGGALNIWAYRSNSYVSGAAKWVEGLGSGQDDWNPSYQIYSMATNGSDVYCYVRYCRNVWGGGWTEGCNVLLDPDGTRGAAVGGKMCVNKVLNVNSNITVSNFVGIGTATPENTLHIKTTVPGVEFEASSASANQKKWIMHSNGDYFYLRASNDGLTDSREAIRIHRSGIELDSLYLGGNVGIGVLTPQARLHVGGSMNVISNIAVIGSGSFTNGIAYIAPLGDVAMGSYTNR